VKVKEFYRNFGNNPRSTLNAGLDIAGGRGLLDKNIRLLWWGVLGILLIVAFAKFLLPVETRSQSSRLQTIGK
jgi:hypothetical protein